MLRRSCGTFHAPRRAMSRPATSTRPSVATSSRSNKLEERRLAGAGRPDEEDELALADLEIEIPQGDDIAFVDLGDVFETNHERMDPRRARRGYQSVRSIPGTRRCDVETSYIVSVCRAPMQVGLDERVEVAVEHGGDVAGLVTRPFVLHELVGRERVGADLAAERDVALVAAQRFESPCAVPRAAVRRGARRGSASPWPGSGAAIARSGTTRRCPSAGA